MDDMWGLGASRALAPFVHVLLHPWVHRYRRRGVHSESTYCVTALSQLSASGLLPPGHSGKAATRSADVGAISGSGRFERFGCLHQQGIDTEKDTCN